MLHPSRMQWKKKLPPGQLGKYLEGIPKPKVVDDIAGVSLQRMQTLAVTPRYVENSTAMGSLVFHHTMYCNGARGPHRPVVIRRVFRGDSLSRWKATTARLLDRNISSDKGDEVLSSAWVDGNAGTDAVMPLLHFGVGKVRGTKYLKLSPQDRNESVAGSHSEVNTREPQPAPPSSKPLRTSSSMSHSLAEPWRVGIAIDPVVPTIQRTIARRLAPSSSSSSSGGVEKCESFLIPWTNLVVRITVPKSVMDQCREVNVERARKQFVAGLRTSDSINANVVESFGLDQGSFSIHVNEGDVLFVPWPITFDIALPVGYEKRDVMHNQTSNQRTAVVGNDESPSETILCANVLYHPFPRLSEIQAKLYMASDYTTSSRLDEFYRKGGNSTTPNYT